MEFASYGRVTVILKGLTAKLRQGKYIIGHPAAKSDAIILVFDHNCDFHNEIVDVHDFDFEIISGGWLRIDLSSRRAMLWCSSEEFGPDPNQAVSRRAIETVLGRL